MHGSEKNNYAFIPIHNDKKANKAIKIFWKEKLKV